MGGAVSAVYYEGAGPVRARTGREEAPGAGEVRLEVAYCGRLRHRPPHRPRRTWTRGSPAAGDRPRDVRDGRRARRRRRRLRAPGTGGRPAARPARRDAGRSAASATSAATSSSSGSTAPGALQQLVDRSGLHAARAAARSSTCVWPRSPSRSRWPATTSAAARWRQGETAVVIGGGPIGLLIALVARVARSARCVVIEVDATRRGLAARARASTSLDPAADDVAARVREATDGAGADVVFEVSGSAAGVLAMTELRACAGGSSSSRSSRAGAGARSSTSSGRSSTIAGRARLRAGGLRARDRAARRGLARRSSG